MKTGALRIYLVILFAFLLLTGTVSAEKASGTAGDLNWTLSDTGALTISGTGEMTEAPWRSEYADQINSVVIKKGVTSIGTQAFIYCTSLTSVSIPDTVTKIGNSAFTAVLHLRMLLCRQALSIFSSMLLKEAV